MQPTAKQLTEFLRESNAIEDVFDMDSLVQARYAWKEMQQIKELSIGAINRVQKILMLHQKLRPNHKGYLCDCNVNIVQRSLSGFFADNNAPIYHHQILKEFPDYHEVRSLLEAWLPRANYVREMSKQSPSTVANYTKNLHIEFENIHPYVDGNGRVGRMILNYHRLQASLPFLIIYAKDRRDYYQWFKH